MSNTRYSAYGLVCVTANNLDDIQRRCKSLMQFCPELGNMDVYDQDKQPCGKMSREIIYMPDVQTELLTDTTL